MWTALIGMMSRDDDRQPAGADRLPARHLRGLRPRGDGLRQETSAAGWSNGAARRRGARLRVEALLGQDVHGRLDAEHRAAPAVLRPRRLDRRRGEPGAHPVLRAAALRRAAPPDLGRHGPGPRARPARRRSAIPARPSVSAPARPPRRRRRSGRRPTSAPPLHAGPRSTSGWPSPSAGWARSG